MTALAEGFTRVVAHHNFQKPFHCWWWE